MDALLIRFLKNIKIENISNYEGMEMKKCSFDRAKNILTAEIYCPIIPSFKLVHDIFISLEKAEYKTLLSFSYGSSKDEKLLANLLLGQMKFILKNEEVKLPKYTYDIKSNDICFLFNSLEFENQFIPLMGEMEDLLDDMNLKTTLSSKCLYESEIDKRDKILQDLLKTFVPQYIGVSQEVEQTKRIKGNYMPIKLIDLNEQSSNICFVGKVFASDIKTTRKDNKMLVTLDVYDKTSSIEVIAFENHRSLSKDKLEKYATVGTIIKVKGYARVSKFQSRLQVMADYISISNEPFDVEYLDTSKEKRVELHLHTKMSTMDGVTTIEDYIKQAKKWGMEAIAITDHGVVQGFPEAQKASEKEGIKMLYGSELYMVDDEIKNISNPSDTILTKASYVVFDLETTGLSSRYDKIIEFGAVKVIDGQVVDNIDFFIDPEIELNDFIINLTHITPSMVKGKTKIKEAIRIIKDFVGDSILVAHNGFFDFDFLNEACKSINEECFKNPLIDTLALSRYILRDNKSHTLGAVCKALYISYDEKVAHRANYDAKVLNDVWQVMLTRITSNRRDMKHYELQNLQSMDLIKAQRPYHLTCFACDPIGLKELFKLISKSHIEHYNNGPRVLRSELEKVREHLLLGSACFNGEVFEAAMLKGEDELKRRMKFYDFIEVQPLENYVFLVNDKQVRSNEDIKRYVLDIIKAGEELNKDVVATSDCHYLHPEDKIFRDIYIFAKLVGGGHHPLNPYGRKPNAYLNPNQHFRSTSEMLDCFSFLGQEKAYEIVIKNSRKIASKIGEVKPLKDKLYPPFIENCDNRLKDRVYKKAHEMYGETLPKLISDRLEAELNGIIKYGYSVQFFIASEIVRKANEDGFIVGSRGSVGSSFVATMADITEVNSLPPHYLCPNCKHIEFVKDENIQSGYDLEDKKCPICGSDMIHDGQDLPFATFLGFNAEKVPDIDLNFSGEYQARAHEMTKTLLGEKNVFRAGTIETVAEKTAFGYVKGYFEALNIDPNTIPYAEMTRLSIGCQDVKRTTGQHPGGIIVIPDQYDVHDFTPIQYPADDMNATWKTTHFDFHAIHDNVLKLDLLGHVDPTALKMLGDISGIDPRTVPMNDKKVISIFNSRNALNCSDNYLNEVTGALGLPEFGTALTRQMLEEIRPTSFADLVRISGLSHGTDVWNGNAQDLLRNKVCDVNGIIACRDDVMLYLIDHGIDNSIAFKTMESVRKGKKVPPSYLETLKEKGIPEYYIESANKCKYLFPKAHAIAYVTMAVRIAWYKVYRPLEYYAVFFSTRSKQYDIKAMVEGKEAMIKRLENIRANRGKKKDDDIEKTLIIALEMAERGFGFENIDIHKSDATKFLINRKTNKLIPPFDTIDGLGESAANSVVEARNERDFTSLLDLTTRTKLNSQNLEQLKNLGVLDDLPKTDQLSLF